MIGPILKAVLDEVKELLSGTGAQVMLKTNFQPKHLPDNTGKFVLLDFGDAHDSVQYPGGLTRIDWKFGFNSYNWEPDAYVDDPSDYSTSLLDFIDMIRVHFEVGNLGSSTGWLTQGMRDIFDVYGFQFTMTGVMAADALDQDGLIMGFKIAFDTTSLDNKTDFIGSHTLDEITDIQPDIS